MKIIGERKYYTVYKTTNLVNGKIYVGFHGTNDLDDDYLGSGKLLKQAVKKYGEECFVKEYIDIFDNQKDAELLESQIVNREFVEREDTYNISLGGNVCILYGESCGVYGKHHSIENKALISALHKGNTYFSDSVKSQVMNVESGVIYDNIQRCVRAENLQWWGRLFILVGEGHYRFIEDSWQTKIIKWSEDKKVKNIIGRAILSENARERFSGKKLSSKQKTAICTSNKKWIEENPEKHYERMMKINKNPEKIAKTAEKHRGMKRSPEACKNISESIKGIPSSIKGKIQINNPLTEKNRYIGKDEPIPEGWVLGASAKMKAPRGKSYTDGITYKLFKNVEDVPEGWVLGGPPKKKKTVNNTAQQ